MKPKKKSATPMPPPQKDRVRPSKAFLIISGINLGSDEQILAILSRVQAYYKAKAVHLGPTAGPKEMKAILRSENALHKTEAFLQNPSLTEARIRTIETQLETQEGVLQGLKDEYVGRIKKLRDAFGRNLQFVATSATSPQDWLNDAAARAVDWAGFAVLSKYLVASAVMPTSERSTTARLSLAALKNLKQHGKNWIVPHPIPSVESLPKPGLNESYNYWTTGSLSFSAAPTQTSEQYRQVHEPAAIVALIDQENGEFHAKHIHFDVNPDDGNLMVLDDGIVFTADRTLHVGSEDRGIFSTDDHAPHQHPGTLGACRGLNRMHKPAWFINGGDAADFSSVCHHVAHLPGQLENKRLVDDLLALKLLLSAQTKGFPSIKRKILIDSNHHEWVTQYVMANPSLIGLLDWPSIVTSPHDFVAGFEVQLRTSGEPETFMFGDYAIRHGDQEKDLIDAEKTYPNGKYLCGHRHRFGSYRRAKQAGCGCGLGPGYLMGRQTGWQSQITTLTKHNEVASVTPKTILHDKKFARSRFAYQNQIVEVDHFVVDTESTAR